MWASPALTTEGMVQKSGRLDWSCRTRKYMRFIQIFSPRVMKPLLRKYWHNASYLNGRARVRAHRPIPEKIQDWPATCQRHHNGPRFCIDNERSYIFNDSSCGTFNPWRYFPPSYVSSGLALFSHIKLPSPLWNGSSHHNSVNTQSVSSKKTVYQDTLSPSSAAMAIVNWEHGSMTKDGHLRLQMYNRFLSVSMVSWSPTLT